MRNDSVVLFRILPVRFDFPQFRILPVAVICGVQADRRIVVSNCLA